jgi:Phospholipase_D-nuclease N-terminal
MIAYTYPILSFIWMGFVFFFYLAVFFAVIWAFIDNFRRPDHSGWAKAGWALVILILPLFGTLIYLIARPAVVDDAVL